MTSALYTLDEMADSQAVPYTTFNEAFLQLEGRAGKVKSRTTTAEPGSPAEGDSYIIPSGATGTSWATYTANDVAQYIGGAWQNATPNEGWRVWVDDEDIVVAFDGSTWSQFGITVINNNTTLTVGTGSPASDYTTVTAALAYLDGKIISTAATVTIEIQDERITEATGITITHPNMAQISIVGKTTYTTTVSNVAAASPAGSAGDWKLTLTLADAGDVAVNNYLLISGCSGGTNPEDLNGVWKVTAVDASSPMTTCEITCTSHYSSAPSGAISGNVIVVPTAIVVTDTEESGIRNWSGYTLGNVDKIVFEGSTNAAIGAHSGLDTSGTGSNIVIGTAVGVTNFERGCIGNLGASLDIDNIYASDNYYGIQCANNSTVRANSGIASGNEHSGVNITKAGFCQVSGPITGNATYGVSTTKQSSFSSQSSGVIAGNGTGAYAYSMSYQDQVGATFSRNGTTSSPAVNTVGNEQAYIDT